MRQCTKCSSWASDDAFYQGRSDCKPCVIERVVRHRRKYWVEEKARRAGNPESDQTRQRRSDRQRERITDRRLTIISAYGGVCACCGDSEPVFLCIDHKNEDGCRERKQVGGKGAGWLQRIIDENFPDRYQVLCFNCNWAKSHGGCPHGNPAGQPGGGA